MAYKHFYHYTNGDALRKIFNQESEDNGLRPTRRFIFLHCGRDLPEKAYDGAIWGMLEPRPEGYLKESWRDSVSIFEDCLEKAKSSIQPTYMLKVELAQEDDVYVADWYVHFREGYEGTRSENREAVYETKKAYWDSLVPLSEYKDGQYRLPEVICFSKIPVDRISIDLVIPGSEFDTYMRTGTFDPKALARDEAAIHARNKRMAKFLKSSFK